MGVDELTSSGGTGGGLDLTDGNGPIGLPNHHINYASGLTNTEVARFTLAAGEQLEVWRLEAALQGGGTDSNVSVNIYDASDSTVLQSVTAGSRVEGASGPLATSTTGATILVRVSTGSAAVDLCATGITNVVEA